MDSYIRDTADLIIKIDGRVVPDSAVLVTLYVTTLYTSILLDEACRVAEQVLVKRNQKEPTTYFLISSSYNVKGLP